MVPGDSASGAVDGKKPAGDMVQASNQTKADSAAGK
jgi:hypothetical protein